MKAEFPTAKTFVAARQYLPAVIKDRSNEDARRQRQRLQLEAERREEEEINARKQEKATGAVYRPRHPDFRHEPTT